MQSVASRLKKWLDESREILILVHENPDGDTLSSSFALSLALKSLGKNVKVAGKDPIPEVFSFLPGALTYQRDFLLGDAELVVIIDCGDLRRTGFPDRLKEFIHQGKKVVNIDHHPKNDLRKIAPLNLINESVSAAGEIIWQVIESLGVEIDKEIATCLLTSLFTDTGGFRHSNTRPETLKLASKLLLLGGRLGKISDHISLNKSIASLRLQGKALSRLKKDSLGVVSSVITLADLKECGASPEDLNGVANLMASIPESKTAILFSEVNGGKIKGSLRTEKEGVDVSRLSRLLGGGGHPKAAGFTLDGFIRANGEGWEIVI